MIKKNLYIFSTVGRKQIVGVTGLLLCGFLLSHVLGNFLIFVGPEAYNMYSHNLISNPLIFIAEAGLVALFFTHLGIAIKLTLENKGKRPQSYSVNGTGDKGTDFISKTMWHQGVIILIFVVYHLITFKYGPNYLVEYEGVMVRDLYRLMMEVFKDPLYIIGYMIGLGVLGVHISHGFSSSFQSLGFHHSRYTPWIERASISFAVFVTVGFISQPLYVFFLK